MSRSFRLAVVPVFLAATLAMPASTPAARADAGAVTAPGVFELLGGPPTRALPAIPPGFATQLVLDDDAAEGTFGVSTGGFGKQFLWFNRFTPAGPVRLQEIWVLFPAQQAVAGDGIELVVFQDADGNPANGANLLWSQTSTVQVADGNTFSIYPIAPDLEILGGGDVLIGVVNRWTASGVDSLLTPATLDTSVSQGRSWLAVWNGDPPSPLTLPADSLTVVVDTLAPGGNWMIRAFGQGVPIVEVPTLSPILLGALAAMLLALGVSALHRRRSPRGRAAVLGAVVALAVMHPAPAAAVTIDSFTTAQAAVIDPPGTAPTVVTGGADIIGTRRAINSDILAVPVTGLGAGPVTSTVAAGVLTLAVTATTPDSRGEALVTWDGDATAGNLNATGLGGQDLTTSGHNAIRIRVNSASAGTELVVDVYTSATAASRAFLRIPAAIGAATDLYLSYQYDFVKIATNPATFSNVGAIQLHVRGTEVSASLDLIDTVGPGLAATKRDLDLSNVPITAPVLEGATFKYRIAVSNNGGTAVGTDLSDTVDTNTALDTASVRVTPLAIDDAYVTVGHVGRSAVAPGLLANDIDPDTAGAPPELAIGAGSVGTFATVLGGSITIAADGAFSYTPPVGVGNAVDTYTYTLQDNDGQTSTGLVKIAIGPRVWFVDKDADVTGGNDGTGTFADPFGQVVASQLAGVGGAGDLDAAGDVIYVLDSASTLALGATLELEAGEHLLGRGVALVIDGQTIVSAGTKPQVTAAGIDAVTIPGAAAIEVAGLRLSSTTGNAIDVTTSAALVNPSLLLHDLQFDGAGAEGIDVNLGAGTTGTLSLAITDNTWNAAGTHTGNAVDVASTNGTLNLDLSRNTGVLSTASGLVATGTAGSFNVIGFSGNTIDGNTGGSGISVTNARFDVDPASASTYETVSGGVTTIGTSGNPVGGNGLTLTSVSGDLAFTDLDAFTSAGNGIKVGGTGNYQATPASGTRVTVVSGAGSVTATGGAALELTNLTADFQFGAVQSTNSSGYGINLTGVNDGPPTNAVVSATSGSSITNASFADVNISSSSVAFTYPGTITDDVGQLVSVFGASDTVWFRGAITDGDDGDGSGVNLSSNTGTVRFSGGLVLSTGSNAAFAATGGGTVEVCDEDPCNAGATGGLVNKITTTTATALAFSSSTKIGPNNLELRSISAGTAGGSAGVGISLVGTGIAAGDGGLHVTGTGTAGSGGTIQHKTGADDSTSAGIGIYLQDTKDARFAWMQLNDFDNSAIAGRNVHGFELTNSVISGVSGNSTGPVEGAIAFGITNPGGTNGLQGTGLIRNTKISGAIEHNLEFYNQSGSMNLTIDGTNAVSEGALPNSAADDVADCIIEENSVAGGGDGIQVEMQGAATATIVVNRCLFRDNKSQPIQIAANDSSAITATISECWARKFDQGNEGFLLSNGSNGDLTAMINGNHVNNIGGTNIFVGQTAGNATASSSLNASILNNVVNQTTTATNHGILVFLTSTVGQVSQARVRIDGNTVVNNSTSGTTRGILVDTPDTGTSPNFNVTVTNNSVAVGDNVAGVSGVVVQSRKSATACANIGGNTVTFPNGNPGVFGLRARQADTATLNIEGSGVCSGAAAAVLACRNPASTTEVLGTVGVVGTGTCLLPAVP